MKTPQTISSEFLTIKELEEAMERFAPVKQDPEAKRIYGLLLKAKNNAINAESHAANKAKREAEARGEKREIEKGKAEGKMEMALKMLSKRMDVTDIAEITGLSVAQVKALQI
ncbi:hypothetical protein FACS189472_06660 [Alphaproteobacteria bacterium]|nr:hypothetical protein FACS189472_06660 [Alphaproteobacteria bacterium]